MKTEAYVHKYSRPELSAEVSSMSNVILLFLMMVMVLAFGAGCAQSPEGTVQAALTQNNDGSDDDGVLDGRFDDPAGANDEDGDDDDETQTPGACDMGDKKSEEFTINADSVEGANVVFLIDDSGSMGQEISGVVAQIQSFLEGLDLAVAQSNYKIVLVFDENKLPIYGANPFDKYTDPTHPDYDPVYAGKIIHVNQETWSKEADVALAKAYLREGSMVPLPSPLPDPLHESTSGQSTSIFGLPEDCAQEYFRPYYDTNSNGRTRAPWCVGASEQRNIATDLIPDVTVNFIALTDDDLNTRSSSVDLMIENIIAPLGSQVVYKYHTIGGNELSSQIDRRAIIHQELTALTGGLFARVDLVDEYDTVFSQLVDEIFYSEQASSLKCEPSFDNLSVRFNGVVLSPGTHYAINQAQSRVEFTPESFEAIPVDERDDPIAVKITYYVN